MTTTKPHLVEDIFNGYQYQATIRNVPFRLWPGSKEQDEIIGNLNRWLQENVKKYTIIGPLEHRLPAVPLSLFYTTVCFKEEEDLLAFKLLWSHVCV